MQAYPVRMKLPDEYVRMTCTVCRTTITPRVGSSEGLCNTLSAGTRLPPTWRAACTSCRIVTTHFLEWPDPATSSSRIKKTPQEGF